ncbi:uncharacterized protein TNCV_3960331 [Trichonephila clavipes]|nr:uncharacterized protein TNCV_3960331 [Trichonephila clavipes]
MLLGQQGGYTKFPSFIREWDDRFNTQYWVKTEWPKRQNLKPGTTNVIWNTLVKPIKVLQLLLLIKLCVMKKFDKAISKDGDCFKYLSKKLPGLSDAKLKEGISASPVIHKLMMDKELETGPISEEKDEMLHQDIKHMEHKYQERQDKNRLADCSWMLT